jgi:starch synthase (maltosyl-transferring)
MPIDPHLRIGTHRRVVIENVTPCVDAGRFAAKRCVGDVLDVEADAFADGHDRLRCRLLWRPAGTRHWQQVEMQELGNDRWRASFTVSALGAYEYTVVGWTDALQTWLGDLARWENPDDIALSLALGAAIIAGLSRRARGDDARRLAAWATALRVAGDDPLARRAQAMQPDLQALAGLYADRTHATQHAPTLRVVVEPVRARFSTWYEMFPRSAGDGMHHGTFDDCIGELPAIKAMGFDVLYLPPIHPIGRTRRKGRNNSLTVAPGDPGSPWAIGAVDGGHRAIHAELGTLDDFKRLLAAAHALDIDVALDIAFQSSPDHPYVADHPAWFRHRPDGSVQFAENPPKKYQDIYPFDFESADAAALWRELLDVVVYWIDQGVRTFRVDNPHTKPLRFWEWLIAEVRRAHPDVIFLAEAFTRPKIMHALAKLGFSQSYTYFTWRNSRTELIEYFEELAHDRSRDFFRPNVWPNTPDILTAALARGERATFIVRLVLAATLSANYGIYGPAYELMDHAPSGVGEEYAHSEKYEIRAWSRDRRDSLRPLIARINAARHEHPALQQDWTLRFCATDNESLLCYAKTAPGADAIVTVVNLDPRNVQSGFVTLDLAALGLDADAAFDVRDLMGTGTYRWRGARNFVRLDPAGVPAHVFHVRAAPPTAAAGATR